MRNKKRNSTQSLISPTTAAAPYDPTTEIKSECERSLTALRRGNHTKALRLMREALAKHSDSALLYRVHGAVHSKLASLIEDPVVKQRHQKAAVESARRAAELSPNSIEYGHFYANMLFDYAVDPTGYELAVSECERALNMENPVDPALELLHVTEEAILLTPEARVNQLRNELSSLVQKCNLASISTWMKTLGGEDKYRLIPVTRFNDPVAELRLITGPTPAPPRRNNEIKKASKTPEERRKEIEVRVAAARLLQQQKGESSQASSATSSSPSGPHSEEDQSTTTSSGSHRRKPGVRKSISGVSTDRMDQVRAYWSSMPAEKQLGFLKAGVEDLKAYYMGLKDTAVLELLSEALSFAETSGTWEFYVCFKCGEKLADSISHLNHVINEHVGSISDKQSEVIPQGVDSDCAEILTSLSLKPIDVESVLKYLEEDNNSNINTNINNIIIVNNNISNHSNNNLIKDSDSDNSEYSSPVESIDGEIIKENGDCNGKLGSEMIEMNGGGKYKWPVSENGERVKLLERIQSMFGFLIKHQCLAVGHLEKIVHFANDEIKNLPSGSQIIQLGNGELESTPLSLCFLDAMKLRNVLKFLQDLSLSCGLPRLTEKESSLGDGGIKKSVSLERVKFDIENSMLIIHGDETETEYEREGKFDASILLQWIYAGPASSEQLTTWARLKEEKSSQALDILQTLEKELLHLQSICERKSENLGYEQGFESIETYLKEESMLGRLNMHYLGYEDLLKRRREEIAEREEEGLIIGKNRFELEAINLVLKDTQQAAFNMAQFGYDEPMTDLNSRISDMDGGGEDDWRGNSFVYPNDSIITNIIHTQKDQISEELSKLDARIMRSFKMTQKLELKMGPTSLFDYRIVLIPLIKSFLRGLLEEMVDKDAKERSDAAQEAFLAELALDAKKSKQSNEKSKEKKKTKDHRKSKESKGLSYDLLTNQEERTEESEILNEVDNSDKQEQIATENETLNQEDEERKKLEETQRQIEEEERKLEQTLEFQRKIEEEAKKSRNSENDPQNNSITNTNGNMTPVFLQGINFGDFHFSEVDLRPPNEGEVYVEERLDVGPAKENLKMNGGKRHVRSPNNDSSHFSNKKGNKTYAQANQKQKQGNSKVQKRASGEPLPVDLSFMNGTKDSISTDGDAGTKSLRQIHEEKEDEERFLEDLKRAVQQSLELDGQNVTSESLSTLSENDGLGAGLKNAVGEYNCFLNVIIQSLWHIRRFRDEFLAKCHLHTHLIDPCVVCALFDVFVALNKASEGGGEEQEPVEPTSLRLALSNLYPDSKFFQEKQMNDASEVLGVIFDCLHKAFTTSPPKETDKTITTNSNHSNSTNTNSNHSNSNHNSNNSKIGSWDCEHESCIAHSLFGMDIFEQMNCYNCQLESRHLKYSSFFHNINASALRTAKSMCVESSFDELLKIVEMNHQLACDMEAGGCGKPNYIHHILSSQPHVFTTVLGWQNVKESMEDISTTLAGLSTEIDISVMYRGIDQGRKHSLVSVVCYYGQHYHCFAYENERWVMYDDLTVKVIGSWDDVIAMCVKGHLQPQVLFFQATD